MSDEATKEKHSKRLHKEEAVVARQTKIAKAYGINSKEPHRYAKKHAMNCGNPKCAMCGNPRKVFGEKTVQEKRFDQSGLIEYNEVTDE